MNKWRSGQTGMCSGIHIFVDFEIWVHINLGINDSYFILFHVKSDLNLGKFRILSLKPYIEVSYSQ